MPLERLTARQSYKMTLIVIRRLCSPGLPGGPRPHRACLGPLSCGKKPDTMRSAEMRKRRSEALPKTCRRVKKTLPYSTLD